MTSHNSWHYPSGIVSISWWPRRHLECLYALTPSSDVPNSGGQLWIALLELKVRGTGLVLDNGQVRVFPFCLNTPLPSSESRAQCATPVLLTLSLGLGWQPAHHGPWRPINGRHQKMPQVIKETLGGPAHPLCPCPNLTPGNSRLWFSFRWLGEDRVSWSWASSPSSLARWVWA